MNYPKRKRKISIGQGVEGARRKHVFFQKFQQQISGHGEKITKYSTITNAKERERERERINELMN